MKPRCKRLSLLLTLCILLSVFTAFPTVSAVSVQPPADAAGAAAVTYEDVLAGLALSGKILICEDISCGVVPMDAETREWREAVGRMNAALAAQADTVTRIFCGLPLELKG